MRAVDKYDLAEINSMNNPPKLVKKVMKCVCILLRVEPVDVVTKSGHVKPSYWRAAISNEVLGNPSL
jgi:hypothetical protein